MNPNIPGAGDTLAVLQDSLGGQLHIWTRDSRNWAVSSVSPIEPHDGAPEEVLKSG